MKNTDSELKSLLEEILSVLSKDQDAKAKEWVALHIRIQKAVEDNLIKGVSVPDDKFFFSLKGVAGNYFDEVVKTVLEVVQVGIEKHLWANMKHSGALPSRLFEPYYKKADENIYAVKLIDKIKKCATSSEVDILTIGLDDEAVKIVIIALISAL